MIFEREEKKRKEQEEKEARKASKELKKKEREEIARQKAEKATQRREEAARKRELVAQRKEEAAKKRELAARRKEVAAKKREAAAQRKASNSERSQRRQSITSAELLQMTSQVMMKNVHLILLCIMKMKCLIFQLVLVPQDWGPVVPVMVLKVIISVAYVFEHMKRIKMRKQIFYGSDVYVGDGSMRTATQK